MRKSDLIKIAEMNAKAFLENARQIELNDYREPHKYEIASGGVGLWWRKKEKGLSVFFYKDRVEYLLSWGMNIYTDVDDGILRNMRHFKQLWTQLCQK